MYNQVTLSDHPVSRFLVEAFSGSELLDSEDVCSSEG